MRGTARGLTLAIALALGTGCATAPPPLVSTYAAPAAEVAEVRAALDGAMKAANGRDPDALVAYYADNARIDSLAAGGKVSKADYRAAMARLMATDRPAMTGGDSTIAFADPTHATARRSAAAGSRSYLIEYRLEKRDGRWLIVAQDYLR